MNRQLGMTLIELMIALAILAILLTVAAPNFQDTIKRNRIESDLREVSTQLKFMRSEAVNTQRTITICHLDSASPAACDTNWSNGLTIFFDDDGDGELENAADTVRVIDAVSPSVLTVKDPANNNQTEIQFGPRGTSTGRATIKLCDSDNNDRYARAFLLELTGMAMHSRINSANQLYKDINDNDLSCP